MTLRLLRVRIVWTLHNLGIHEERPDERLNVAIHRQLVRNAGAVIAHCEAAVRAAVDTYGLNDGDAGKLQVIPHGNYVDVYGPLVERSAARERLGVPADVRLFVFIGGVRAYKGITELIEAIRALPADTNARLIVAGRAFDEAEADAVREAAGDDERITLRLEFIPDEELPVLLGRSRRGGAAVPRHPHVRVGNPGHELRPAGHRAVTRLPAGDAAGRRQPALRP